MRAIDDVLGELDELDGGEPLADEVDDALDELEDRLGKIHRQYLWDGAADPDTGKMSQRQRTAMQRAHGVRQAARLVEQMRMDGLA